MSDIDKRKRYKTAYSHMFNCTIGIKRAWCNDGLWVFTCFKDYGDIREQFKDYLFTEDELSNFTL
jgi:hypothetical protein